MDKLGVNEIRAAIFGLLCMFSFTYGDHATRVAQLESRVVDLEKQGKLQSHMMARLIERLDHQEMALTSQSDTIRTQSEQLQSQGHVVQTILSALQRQKLQLKRLNQYILTSKRASSKTQTKAAVAALDKMEKRNIEKRGGQGQADRIYRCFHTNNKHLTETGGKNSILKTSSDAFESERSQKRQVSNNGEQVAFHVVIDKEEVPNLGVNQNIVFDVVLLNLGGAYHNQHGLFIAPKQGLYMFSASILSYVNSHAEFRADLKKNGVVLARVFGHGDNGREDQGSVTVVTQMGVGDEVWVSLAGPVGDSIFGGRYTTFTGYMINPTVDVV